METIFALASARGKSGVAVIRVSGPQACAVGAAIAGRLPDAHVAALRRFRGPAGEVIDQGLVLWFPKGHSFTGEDVVEFQVHGSPAVVGALMRALGDRPGVRPAEPGEFTRRAFENERLDLAQVEGLADLVEAETEGQRRQALRVFSGDLGRKVETWRTDLVRAGALLEATIDFAEEDVPVDVFPEVHEILSGLARELDSEARGAVVAERMRDGFEVAIIGAPNVGKSTLLNHLARREAAITSDIAGTTRDVIEVRMDLNGLPVTLLDTAGLRESTDAVETIGVARSLDRARAADLRVFLLSASDEVLPLAPMSEDIVVIGKADQNVGLKDGISGKTGHGVPEMLARITDVLERRASGIGLAMRERHRVSILAALEHLEACFDLLQRRESSVDLAAEELRSAAVILGGLVGRVDVEHILDEVFSRFCIGK